MESEERNYQPTSGPYRKYRNLVSERVVEIERQFESQPKWEDLLYKMFSLSTEEIANLTFEENEDIKNYVRHAVKRLGAGAVSAPIHQKLLAESAEKTVRQETAVAFIAHDLVHSLVAYIQNDGKSLNPYFNLPDSKDEVYFGVQANQEELMVFLWNDAGIGNFFDFLVGGGDPLEFKVRGENFLDVDRRYCRGYVQKYCNIISEIAHVREEAPFEYCLRVFEARFLLAQQLFFALDSSAPEFEEKLSSTLMQIEAHRDPKYVAMARVLYDNSRLEKPDPKIRLHEFQRIVQPLLNRLRIKSEVTDTVVNSTGS